MAGTLSALTFALDLTWKNFPNLTRLRLTHPWRRFRKDPNVQEFTLQRAEGGAGLGTSVTPPQPEG